MRVLSSSFSCRLIILLVTIFHYEQLDLGIDLSHCRDRWFLVSVISMKVLELQKEASHMLQNSMQGKVVYV